VKQGYDTCLEDVRNQTAFDYAYSLALRTFTVMVAGRGHSCAGVTSYFGRSLIF
jgi:hypothetical protein